MYNNVEVNFLLMFLSFHTLIKRYEMVQNIPSDPREKHQGMQEHEKT
jgi:hypothetical protein